MEKKHLFAPYRTWWLIALSAYLIQFIIFKFHYPFANYMPDSYSYLEAASTDVDVNIWPVAYSKFLRLVSVFTHSDKLLVGFQYFFFQCSALIFIISLISWLKPGKILKTILFLFFIFDPLPLYIANYISADALFIGLSLLWITNLGWIIYQPKRFLLVTHALLLLACFTVRYNAIYYPFVSILVFILSRTSWKLKVSGIAVGLALLASSVLFTSQKMKEITGQWQFSAFGGWQLANNALYMYQHIPAGERGAVPTRFAGLETMVRQHMDTLYKIRFTHDDTVASHFYLWSPQGPLVQYLVRQYKKDSVTPYFKRWASEGPLYAQYARSLIVKYPVHFVQEFMLPNAVKYAVPPTEFLGMYNMGSDSVGKLAKDWFNYKSLRVQTQKKKPQSEIPTTAWFPIFGSIVNVVLVIGIMAMAFLGAIPWKEYGLPQFLLVVLAFWLTNAAFSIFASPVVLRYQVFPILVAFAIGSILIERIYQMARSEG